MTTDQLIAVYYPDAYIKEPRSLAAYTIYFDEVHFITFDDGAVNPTEHLASLPDKTHIYSFGTKDEKMVERTALFYQFAMQYRELIGTVLFYEPHLLCQKLTEIVNKMVGIDEKKLYVDDLLEFFRGGTEEQKAISDCEREFPELSDDILLRVAPTALYLAKKNEWLLISDREESPIPYFSDTIRNAEQLSSILAEECLIINLPAPLECRSEDLLELRDKLSSELIPFRNMMLKASRLLRDQIKDVENLDILKKEARFFIKTYINPAVSELEHRIKMEQGKLWRRAFGRILGFVPIAANAFLAPSVENIYRALSKASKDVEDLLITEHNVTISRDPGIAFLLKVRAL